MTSYDFPKVELHLHLDGAFRFQTVWELAQEQGVELPGKTLEEYIAFIEYSRNCGSVNQYLRMFDDPQKVMQDAASLSRITYELIEDLAAKGLAYVEIRFAPQFHTQGAMSQADAVEAVLDGRARALADFPGIHIGIICCMMSLGPTSVNEAANYETIEVCHRYLGKGIVGIDLAGAEGLVPLSDFAPFFEKARAYDLPMTCHAGDSQGADTVRDAIGFGVTRIGHGHHIVEDLELCEVAAERGIALEICPTSNIQCQTEPSYAEHPAKRLLELGIPVTISTDNMTLAGVTVNDEYDHCLAEMGFAPADLVQMNVNAVRAAFMDESLRADLLARLAAARI